MLARSGAETDNMHASERAIRFPIKQYLIGREDMGGRGERCLSDVETNHGYHTNQLITMQS
jgi:hypothetical protein